ncbi:hypothetical protein C8J57DRAFT_1660322, partial [Mycena rebaudengoi]
PFTVSLLRASPCFLPSFLLSCFLAHSQANASSSTQRRSNCRAHMGSVCGWEGTCRNLGWLFIERRWRARMGVAPGTGVACVVSRGFLGVPPPSNPGSTAPPPAFRRRFSWEEKVYSALGAHDKDPFSYVNGTSSGAFPPFSRYPIRHQHQAPRTTVSTSGTTGASGGRVRTRVRCRTRGVRATRTPVPPRDSYPAAARVSYSATRTSAARASSTAAALPHPSKAHAPELFPLALPSTLQLSERPE